MDAAKELALIRKKLQHLTTDWAPKCWLDTGSPELNLVLGSPRGLPYGKMLEVSGHESHGKTALVLELAAAAQKDGAAVIWFDAENSYDEVWCKIRGLDTVKVAVVYPYVGTFGKEKGIRLSTAQELCEEVEGLLARIHRRGGEKIFLALDSVTALLTEDEAAGGLTGQNMRTQMALPMFLGKLMRRWTGLFQSYNVLGVFINQIRIAPMAYGNPEYTPGGKALKYYCSVRATVRRVKGGRLLRSGRIVGLKGVVKNIKNKAGGVEGAACGYKLFFDGRQSKFPSEKSIRGEEQ